ncbi:unnamed protein product [Schistosoma margrebowiei]|uniref:Uncharacterized protein n=1 Tax=Schistosoma margrebowiei TaxID=48269 RepID=A0A183LEM8_9TREM|nr:unnamed protein product [Schistosoma margrebowiei]
MKTSTSERKHGIQWTARNQLDDLDFADDLALLSPARNPIARTNDTAGVLQNNPSLILLAENIADLADIAKSQAATN